jgi:hypothetical protein
MSNKRAVCCLCYFTATLPSFRSEDLHCPLERHLYAPPPRSHWCFEDKIILIDPQLLYNSATRLVGLLAEVSWPQITPWPVLHRLDHSGYCVCQPPHWLSRCDAQIHKNLLYFCGTWNFTRARCWSLSWARLILSMPPGSVPPRSIFILHSHVCPSLPTDIYSLLAFPPNPCTYLSSL